jgi:hypothetical protein
VGAAPAMMGAMPTPGEHLSNLVATELRRAGGGPRDVRVGLHQRDLAELQRWKDASGFNLAFRSSGVSEEFYGYLVQADPFAPPGVVLIRPRG